MDKKLATLIQAEATAALTAIAAKHGMTVRAHGGSLAEVSAILKFEFKTADKAVLVDAERTTFERHADLFGLLPTDYGREFTANGKAYTVTGFDLKRRKYPILVTEKATGKRSCFTDLIVPRIVAARGAA
jgi:hypothetical protein